MTSMTREELIANLKEKLGVREGDGVDLQGEGYALVIAMEPEEVTEELVGRLQALKAKKDVRRLVAIPPKATVMHAARERTQGTGIGVIDGRGFIIKPFSWTRYRSVPLGTYKS